MLKVSVIIAVSNAQKYLRECLDSVIGQTLKDIEIICIDDASDDSTPSILNEYVEKYGCFRVFRHENKKNAGVARNRGLKEAAGKYIVFWDADDFFEPDALEKMYTQCETDAADICICGGRIYNEFSGQVSSASWFLNLEYLPPEVPFAPIDYAEWLFLLTNPAAWNKMFSVDFLAREGLLFQDLSRSNDLCFTYSAVASARKITAIDSILINYRVGTETSLQDTNRKDPFCFYQALTELRNRLIKKDIFQLFQKGYASIALSNCLYNLNSQTTKEDWLIVAMQLKKEIFRGLGISKYPENYFQDYGQFKQMLWLMKQAPRKLAVFSPVLRSAKPTEHNARKTLEPEQNTTSVSVVIPLNDSLRYLDECLDSVARQSLAEIEIICVFYGSHDDSIAKLERWQASDSRIKTHKLNNVDFSTACNYGMGVAQGKFIILLDSSDLLCWCALEHMFALAQNQELDTVLCDVEFLYDPPILYKENSYYRNHSQTQANCTSPVSGQDLFIKLMENTGFRPGYYQQLLRASYLRQNHIELQSGTNHETNLLMIHSLLSARQTMLVSEPLCIRRIYQESVVLNKQSRDFSYGSIVREQEALERDLEELRQSRTYRIGSTLAQPLKKLKRLLRY